MALSLELERKQTYWKLSVSGELDYAECSQFRLRIHQILRSGPRFTVVDMNRLAFVDSSGLGVLLAMSRECAATGGQLVLVTNETLDRLLSVAQLDRVFRTASSAAEAIQMIRFDAPIHSRHGVEGGTWSCST